MITTPTRPVLRYHGGKWLLARRILRHFPPHRIYCEPFGGAASVLLQKPRVYSEVYNDLEGEVVNLFRVLRDPVSASRLCELIRLTPFSRAEFLGAYEPAEDPIEQARRIVVRGFMGFGSAAASRYVTGFRAQASRSGTTPAHDWLNWPEAVPAIVERLRGVTIECRPAVEVIRQQDHRDALFYCDPPYPFSTRALPRGAVQPYCYRHEMTDDDHRELASALRTVRGSVVLSGYACDLYDRELYPDWLRIEQPSHADGARDRTEVLWLSPAAVRRSIPDLFSQQGGSS